jgi:hypothetical protein
MADPIKVIASEITLSNTTPNTVNSAKLVRIVNLADSPNDVLVTLAYANGTTKGTFTLGHDATGYSTLNLVKDPTDTLLTSIANNTVVTKAVSIAYS